MRYREGTQNPENVNWMFLKYLEVEIDANKWN